MEDFREHVSVETKKMHLFHTSEKKKEQSKTIMKPWSKRLVHGLMKAHQATCYAKCRLKENGQLQPVDKSGQGKFTQKENK